jgi:hypothetical protein
VHQGSACPEDGKSGWKVRWTDRRYGDGPVLPIKLLKQGTRALGRFPSSWGVSSLGSRGGKVRDCTRFLRVFRSLSRAEGSRAEGGTTVPQWDERDRLSGLLAAGAIGFQPTRPIRTSAPLQHGSRTFSRLYVQSPTANLILLLLCTRFLASPTSPSSPFPLRGSSPSTHVLHPRRIQTDDGIPVFISSAPTALHSLSQRAAIAHTFDQARRKDEFLLQTNPASAPAIPTAVFLNPPLALSRRAG